MRPPLSNVVGIRPHMIWKKCNTLPVRKQWILSCACNKNILCMKMQLSLLALRSLSLHLFHPPPSLPHPHIYSTWKKNKQANIHSYKYTFTHPHIVSLMSYPRVFYYKRHRTLFGIFCAWKKKLLSMYTNWVFAYL